MRARTSLLSHAMKAPLSVGDGKAKAMAPAASWKIEGRADGSGRRIDGHELIGRASPPPRPRIRGGRVEDHIASLRAERDPGALATTGQPRISKDMGAVALIGDADDLI
jgi:hypothetical protein